ncbi:MAG: 23S rRNA (uracil(1939)-C(5))-methyltransferase RlmD [Streptococcaceae bacterium]|nr:23S rRNA (uracil(1939)-C(5))-methyltransferase RlmD [Streptococcaceae bacterium]
MQEFKKNQIYEVEIIDLSHEGLGIAKIDSFIFFVENALPEERINMRITKIGKTFGFGRVEHFIKKSIHRVESLDLDYLRTGIADLGHLQYTEQLKFKKNQVIHLLRKIAKREAVGVYDTIGMGSPLSYRNKAQVPVREINGRLETGFFRKNSHDLIPIENFYIQNSEIDRLILFVRDLLREHGVIAYDEKRRTGLIRNLVVRRGHYSGQIMLIFVLTSKNFPKLEEIKTSICAKFPNIKSILLNVNTSNGNSILGQEMHTIFGQDYITDSMLDKTFQISARAFYQVNTEQAEKLYQIAYEYAELRNTDTIIDAYSGIGTIGLAIADEVQKVYGMEVVRQAVEDANNNAQVNNIDNANYQVGSAEEVMPEWIDNGIKPDVIFVDPPRKGLDEAFINAATATGARSIIYISCNPATFARDVVRFEEMGYQLEKVQPVDLFPQTHHIECVGKFILKRRKGKNHNVQEEN